jgi:hypothetical protein
MFKLVVLLALSISLLSCTKAAVPVAETFLSGEAAAARLGSTLPEGWRISGPLQSEKPVVGFDFSGDGTLDFIAILERDAPSVVGQEPGYALFYAEGQADGNLRQVFLNPKAFQEAKTGAFTDSRLARFDAAGKTVQLGFEGGSEWQWTAGYDFDFEDGNFYLSSAKTVIWHRSDPNAIDQKEYDFKSYFLRSTVINDCGDITCKEVQFTGDNEKLRVRLADFHYNDSLISFADLL